MMKKLVVGLTLVVYAIVLLACQSKDDTSPTWLEGEWYSEEWNLTYKIDEEQGKWSIEFTEGMVVETTELSVNGKIFTLTDKEGTDYIIEKKSDTEILYQQQGVEGVAGTTSPVIFEKVED